MTGTATDEPAGGPAGPGGPVAPGGPGAPGAPGAPTGPAARLPGTWTLTWHGVRTVARLELRQRIRSTRWIVALVAWFVVVGVITGLAWLATTTEQSGGAQAGRALRGPVVFGLVVFFVLFLGLLVAPTLSATSINGDRSAGTLAILQVTLLSTAEIVLGKLLASWVAALAFLAASTPFIAISLLAGGTPVLAMFTCLGVLALLLVAVCAIGLGFSALTARTAGSAVLTYLAVASLSALSPIIFGLTFLATTHNETVRVWTAPDGTWDSSNPPECSWQERVQPVTHTERTWWLLAINPFVIVADAAPQPRPAAHSYVVGGDPLGAIRNGVRTLRAGPAPELDQCWVEQASNPSQSTSPVAARDIDASAVWPWGLAANLLLGAGGVWVAVRRLRIPQRTLARGTRVA